MQATTLNVKLITENLADELIHGMRHASGIYIMTSFVMSSGVRLMAPHLKFALDRGAEVKFLVGDYLFITQPEGLQSLHEIDSRLEARLWRSQGTSFHPKAYLFDRENGEGLLIVGSSNFSLSAMRMGIEWNLAMNAQAEPYTFQIALDKFLHNFYHASTMALNLHTIELYREEYLAHYRANPELIGQIAEMDAEEYTDSHVSETDIVAEAETFYTTIQPRFAQIEALDALERTVEEEYDKAMVVMATGLGKTYLAAFFAKRYARVLFIAHREEILMQAQRAFQHVLADRSTGLFYGHAKEASADCVFASIYTLSMKKHREAFQSKHFDLIVIDEYHHAAAASYRSVIQYFQPRFMLGITATPDRMDGQDVYALCDGNVAYQLHFIEAIRRGWLSPFHYYGVYDETDYTAIRWLGSHYDDEELLAVQLKASYAERVYEAWMRHRQTRTIGFCSSTRQADFLARFFQERGVVAYCLYSGSVGITRKDTIIRLNEGSIDIVFTVDLFNEGVDIPRVDTLLFVRPTESLTVFTQQVGRGLRLAEGKTHCTIIDLIGNYRNADVKLGLLDDSVGGESDSVASAAALPVGCLLQLDTAVINLLEELSRKRRPYRELLLQDFTALMHELNRIPTYLELHLYSKNKGQAYRNTFGSYPGVLLAAGQLSREEEELLHRYQAWIQDVERTVMTKSYKMIVLMYMLERGPLSWTKPVNAREVAPFFYHYLMEKEHRRRIDFSGKEAQRLWQYDEKGISQLIERMPMTKWSEAKGSMTQFEDGVFSLKFAPEPEHLHLLHHWTLEICLYRLHLHFERKG